MNDKKKHVNEYFFETRGWGGDIIVIINRILFRQTFMLMLATSRAYLINILCFYVIAYNIYIAAITINIVLMPFLLYAIHPELLTHKYTQTILISSYTCTPTHLFGAVMIEILSTY